MTQPKSTRLVDARAVAERFDVSIGTVRRWVRERRIPCRCVTPRVIRFDLAEVERAVARTGGAACPR